MSSLSVRPEDQSNMDLVTNKDIINLQIKELNLQLQPIIQELNRRLSVGGDEAQDILNLVTRSKTIE